MCAMQSAIHRMWANLQIVTQSADPWFGGQPMDSPDPYFYACYIAIIIAMCEKLANNWQMGTWVFDIGSCASFVVLYVALLLAVSTILKYTFSE